MRLSVKGARVSVWWQAHSRAAASASAQASAGRGRAGGWEQLAMARVAYGKGRAPR